MFSSGMIVETMKHADKKIDCANLFNIMTKDCKVLTKSLFGNVSFIPLSV